MRTATLPQATRTEPTTSANWLLFSPILVISATVVVFRIAMSVTSDQSAQLIGYAFYWATIGPVIPLVMVGRRGYAELFATHGVHLNATLRAALILAFAPIAFGFLFVFPLLFPVESNWLLVALAAYALVNGMAEEVFWRGLFIRRFRDNAWLGVVVPAVLFASWQLVPLAIFHTWLRPSGPLVFGVALSIGLLYGWIAWRMRSIRLTTLAHVLTNLSAIGSLLIFAPPG